MKSLSHCLGLVLFLISFGQPVAAQDGIDGSLPNIGFQSQNWEGSSKSIDARHSIGFNWNLFGGSNALSAKFQRSLLLGGHLDADLKSKISSKLKDANNFGIENGIGLNYSYLLGDYDDGFRLGGSISNHLHLSSSFAGDLWKIVFEGNKGFAGQTAEMTDSRLGFVSYNKINAFADYLTEVGDLHLELGLGLNLYLGSNHWKMDFGQMNLFTEETGEYVELNFQSNTIELSDTSLGGLTTIGGIGGGVDLRLFVRNEDKGFAFGLDVDDIGIINWKDEGSTSFVFDVPNYKFEGVDINRFFNAVASAGQQNEIDSLVDLLEPEKNAASGLKSGLPIKANVFFNQRITDDFSATLGINNTFFHSLDYLPLIYLKGHYLLEDPDLILSASAFYGGFGGFDFGLEANKEMASGFSFVIGSNGILGLLIPKSTTTTGIYAGASIKF